MRVAVRFRVLSSWTFCLKKEKKKYEKTDGNLNHGICRHSKFLLFFWEEVASFYVKFVQDLRKLFKEIV